MPYCCISISYIITAASTTILCIFNTWRNYFYWFISPLRIIFKLIIYSKIIIFIRNIRFSFTFRWNFINFYSNRTFYSRTRFTFNFNVTSIIASTIKSFRKTRFTTRRTNTVNRNCSIFFCPTNTVRIIIFSIFSNRIIINPINSKMISTRNINIIFKNVRFFSIAITMSIVNISNYIISSRFI